MPTDPAPQAAPPTLPPAPAASPARFKAVLDEASDERVVLSKPGTSYQLHLGVLKEPSTPVGKRIWGVIHADAQRVDVVGTGGAYIEPVYGTPRRIQGDILEIDPRNNTITVDAGVPMVCRVTGAGQKAADFAVGQFVTFDLKPGAAYTPVG